VATKAQLNPCVLTEVVEAGVGNVYACYGWGNDAAMLVTSHGRHLYRFLVCKSEYCLSRLNVPGVVAVEGDGYASPMRDVLMFCCCSSLLCVGAFLP
jgi:hypothetical protein